MSSIHLVDYSSEDEDSTKENVLEGNGSTEEWIRGRLLNKIISDVITNEDEQKVSSSSSDDTSSDDEKDNSKNSSTEEWIRGRLLNKIISDVINVSEERKDKETLAMTIDRNPSFDVYRPKQRLMSECSSVITNGDEHEVFSSSSDDTSSDDEKDNSEDNSKRKKPMKPPKVKGELDACDLPPIEDLTITVPEEKCFLIGQVKSCVDNLVVVESIQGLPAIDLDSVLFLEKGNKTLGQIFDVFGRVDHPCYCVRFNSSTHIQDRDVTPGLDVFYAPETEHTTFIFVEQLKKLKGSDASWKHNHEAPSDNFSDDESEVMANTKKVNKRLQKNVRNDNCFYNSSQQSSNSSFYRTARRHRPQGYGPIQWNSRHVTGYTPAAPIPDFSRPPPGIYAQHGASNMPPPSSFYHHPQWYQIPSQPPANQPYYNLGQPSQNPSPYIFQPPPPPPTQNRPNQPQP